MNFVTLYSRQNFYSGKEIGKEKRKKIKNKEWKSKKKKTSEMSEKLPHWQGASEDLKHCPTYSFPSWAEKSGPWGQFAMEIHRVSQYLCHKLFLGIPHPHLSKKVPINMGPIVNRFRDIHCCVEIREMLWLTRNTLLWVMLSVRKGMQ